MKRLTIIIALVLMTMPMMAEHVTPETAHKVATTFLNNNGAKATQLTDLSKSAGFPNLYIFTSEQGFVIMSADDCVKPILGYSLTNTFVAEGMPENINSWLQGYSDEIQWAIDNKQRATSETAQQWKDLVVGKPNVAKVDVVVEPLIQTDWNQNPYYNNFCPFDSINQMRTVTGCVATAMAQIMKYWNYPSHGIGSHSYTPKNHPIHGEQYANFGATFYDWSNMPLSLSTSSAPEQTKAVATLMYHCGVSVDMDYDYSQAGTSHSGSSASTEQAALAFKTYFNYSPSIEYKNRSEYDDATWIDMLKAELDENRPLQYRGKNPSSSGGHSFICDGYDKENNFHFNWGWGICNGYFLIDNLKPDDSHNYTSNQGAIFGIQPIDCSALEPTNLTLTANESNITLSWTAANGANSYNIYCNNTYLGNSTVTNYSTSASFGTNAYYVRSLDTNNALSLSSNIVTNTMDYQTPIVNDLTTLFSDNTFTLSWTEPNWCYPNYPTTTLTYGEGNINYTWPSYYYAHRYLAIDLAPYANMSIYKIATYIIYPGTYTAYIYTNTSNGQPDENSLTVTKSIIATGTNEWLEFTFDNPILLSDTNDLWVVIKPENIEATYSIPSFNLSEYNENACYASTSSPTSLSSLHYIQSYEFVFSWYIKVHLTDGLYTYNLYDNDIKLNGETPISDTSYTIENIENNTIHNYSIKTNYYGGETVASNTASLALGSNTLTSLTLENNDNMTIGNGSALTVNGMLTNNNPENLVLENGAQLFNSSEGVKATVKNSVTAYTSNTDGWNFIASPVTESLTPDEVNGLLYGNYDLYRLNENPLIDESTSIGKEWENYKSHSDDFSIANGQGYLYANSEDNTLQFVGTLNANDGDVSLNYHPDAQFAGWNLAGNPFPCNTIITKANESISYYVIDDQNNRMLKSVTAGTVIAPGTGVIVKAEGQGEHVTFNKATQHSSVNQSNLQMTVAQNVLSRGSAKSIVKDNAIVSFNEGHQLEKFYFGDNNASIYIPKDSREYAIQCAEIQGEMPINFRTTEDGSYTLTINPEGVEINYLHLIDNITGADVDLLTNPSYNFEAKITDYESRFKLVYASGSVFGDDASTGSASFAFFNNGQWIINNNGESTIQVLDVTGRILRNERISGGCGIQINYAPGVYVLRLINGKKVMTQKIVIE